jgi:hypothetical protein
MIRFQPEARRATAGQADAMILLPTDPASVTTVTVIASALMVLSGMGKKRLRWRSAECPVCHHRQGSCTCRWL